MRQVTIPHSSSHSPLVYRDWSLAFHLPSWSSLLHASVPYQWSSARLPPPPLIGTRLTFALEGPEHPVHVHALHGLHDGDE
jgi:hypothetical protein